MAAEPADRPGAAAEPGAGAARAEGLALLAKHHSTCDAAARLLGCDAPGPTAPVPTGLPLLATHPTTAPALGSLPPARRTRR
ncbi:hypothetical protein [Streptacidiphilus neutrinimicus]|uniref:hypothetical protein n=1 Tax=Streptacidiphilus neutrinimicus TaxID=105420 RepID=UPI0005AA63B3|nr:hypothetical protein [Streptacidiphilus neutrinimicus]